MAPRFPNVSCSQCGQSFGPGDHGFSHCRNHAGLRSKEYTPDPECLMPPDEAEVAMGPDYSRAGMFVLHSCARCKNGERHCIQGDPRRCEFPHARND